MRIHIPAEFTLEELLAFIEGQRPEAVEGYYTSREWATHVGINDRRMRTILKQAKERGLLDMIRVERESLDGRTYLAPAYALRKANEEPDISDSQEPIGPG